MNTRSDLDDALQHIAERHGRGWQVVAKLAGGYSAGAHLLRAPDGGRAVLKLHPHGVTAARLTATSNVIDKAIAAGWRTPRWVASGLLPAGGFYVIQEFIDGARTTALTDDVLDLLLVTNRRQADLRPETDRDWSAYVRDVVFERGSGYAGRMRERPDTLALLERLETMTAAGRGMELPTTDLVHGDFTLDNAILREGEAYLVDADFVGKGSRAIDVAILLIQAGTGRIGAIPSTIDRLHDECEGLVGRSGLLVCVAARIMGLVDFGLDHWTEDVGPFLARSHAFLTELFGDDLGRYQIVRT